MLGAWPLMAGMEPGIFVTVVLVVLLGSAVQTLVGLGIGMVIAPPVALLAPELMPGVPVILSLVLPILTLAEERRDVDWHALNWSLPARIPGTLLGVWMVERFSSDELGFFIGATVLMAVVVTSRTAVLPVNRATLSTAGLIGGITGTTSSIGGPPFALLYQHHPPHQFRSTMAIYFVFGAAISLVGLTFTDEFSRQQLTASAVLLPAVAFGALVGVQLRRFASPAGVRPAVLLLSGASALMLVISSAF